MPRPASSWSAAVFVVLSSASSAGRPRRRPAAGGIADPDVGLAASRIRSMATSSSPTDDGANAALDRGRPTQRLVRDAARPATGPREPCGHPMAGTSPIGLRTTAGRLRAPRLGQVPTVLVSDPAGNVVASSTGSAGPSRGRPTPLASRHGSTSIPGPRSASMAFLGNRRHGCRCHPGWRWRATRPQMVARWCIASCVPSMVPLGPRSDVWELPIDGSAPRPGAADDLGPPEAHAGPTGHRWSGWTKGRSCRADSRRTRSHMACRGSRGFVDGDPGLVTGRRSDSLPRVEREMSRWTCRSSTWRLGLRRPMAMGESAVSLHVIAFSPEGDRLLYARSEGDAGLSVALERSVSTAPTRACSSSGTFYGDWRRLGPPADSIRAAEPCAPRRDDPRRVRSADD